MTTVTYQVDGQPVDRDTFLAAFIERGGPERVADALAVIDMRLAREKREAASSA
jgi:hypothetical protein